MRTNTTKARLAEGKVVLGDVIAGVPPPGAQLIRAADEPEQPLPENLERV
jgi:hypothetical protein